MLGGIELVKDEKTRERWSPEGRAGTVCRNHCFNTGVIMRAVGDTMFLSPPLLISNAEIDELFDLARRSLDLTLQELES